MADFVVWIVIMYWIKNNNESDMPSSNINNVYMAIRRSLAKVASTIVPPKEIEDIVQETYVRICEISNEEEIQYPRSFMYKIVRNLALDHIKRAEARLSVSLDDEVDQEIKDYLEGYDEDKTFQDAASKEEFEMFCKAVRQLPVQCRRVFVLKKVYGYSQKEIAIDLNISESTVEKHIAFGIKRCSYFMDYYQEPKMHTAAKDSQIKESLL
jgi:RNA polymerase sigma factor (sigma-70 family)